MDKTQFEILKRVEELYTEISRITTQIDLEQDNSEKIIKQREELLKEIIVLKKEQTNYVSGASEEEIKKLEERIKSLILIIMSDSAILLDKAKVTRDSMKHEISKMATANKAAKSYAASKR